MIDGNTIAEIQVRENARNSIGEDIIYWKPVQQIAGWLDLTSGDSKYTSYNAKVQESTHVFIADYQVLDGQISPENSRMVVNNRIFDVMVIDDPMEMHRQLEIYLKYTGGV